MDKIVFAETELESGTMRAATVILNIHNWTAIFPPLSELRDNIYFWHKATENTELGSIKLVQ